MALGFLGDLFDDFGAGDVLDLAQAGVGIAGLLGNKQKLPSQTRNALNQNQAISAALMNPDDPMFQRLAAEHEERINRDFALGLRQLMTMDRRARARGVGMLNPERRDEAIAQASARGRANSGLQGREAARAYLMNAANVNNAAFNVTAPLMQMDQNNRQATAGGIEGLFDVGRRLLNGNPAQSGSTVNVNLTQPNRAMPDIYTGG